MATASGHLDYGSIRIRPIRMARATRNRLRSALLSLVHPQLTIIATPYKVGSTTIFDRLCQPFMYAGGHAQLIDGPPPQVLHFAIKMHTGEGKMSDLEQVVGRPASRIITLLRNQADVFVSAYFQNIADAQYPYYFGSRSNVLNAKPQTLVEHFLSFDWASFPHLSIRQNAEEIAQRSGVNYLDHIDRSQRFTFRIFPAAPESDSGVQVAVAAMKVLHDPCAFRAFVKQLRLPLTLFSRRVRDIDANVGDAKWYKTPYQQVKALLRDDPRFVAKAAGWCRYLPVV